MVDSCDSVGSVESPSRAEWLSFCEGCDAATFFHTPYWSDLFERSFGGRYRAMTRLLRFCDGTTLLMPMVTNRRFFGIFRTVCAMPGGTFGGWLSKGTISSGKEAAAAVFFDRFPNVILRENPYQPFTAPFAGCGCIDDYTRTVDVTAGYEAVWMRATAAHRNATRNAARRGVIIHEAVSHADWDAYASVYHRSIDRWKARKNFTGVFYPPSFFGRIEQMDPPLRSLFLATVKGIVVAGILCFRWKRHMVVWHGAGLSDYFSYHPNNLLYDRAIARAVDHGCAWLDCNPSGGLGGVDKFKQYLGAEKRRSRVFVRRSPMAGLLDRLRGRRCL